MTNQLQTYQFNNFNLRVITDEKGDLWFIAKDVAEILGYKDTEAMTRKLDSDEVQNLQIVGFGNRGMTTINESGLFSAVLTSQKPEAKTFKRWVTHEVLPAIRKHGYYAKQKQANPFEDIIPELPPIMRVQSALLSELRRMSKSLAQVYLLECGVTPSYIKQQLEKLGDQVAIGMDGEQSNIMPLALLQQEIPMQAEYSNEKYFFLRRPAFQALCGDYDVTATARMLRDKHLLMSEPNSFTYRATKSMFDGTRPKVFAIKKSIVDYSVL